MAWIESHQQLRNHPKVILLAQAMGWGVPEAIGRLHMFWWWVLDYAEDGDLRRYNDELLAGSVGLDGSAGKKFVTAMVQSGWIDREPYFRVHEWFDYIGTFLQIRYKNKPEKWQCVKGMYQERSYNVPKNVVTTPHLTKPNLTLPERDDAVNNHDKVNDKTNHDKDKKHPPRASIKKEKRKYLEFVFLEDSEYHDLTRSYGVAVTTEYINRLNGHIGAKGDKYKAHYWVIRNWASKDGVKKKSPPAQTVHVLVNEEEREKVRGMIHETAKNMGAAKT